MCTDPMVIHKGQRVNSEWCQFSRRGVTVRCSDTGYIKAHLFDEYARIFVKFLRDNGLLTNEKKHIVLLDGHNSHIFNLDFIDFMIANGIEVLAIPAHTSHVIQPLDGAPFANVKKAWYDELDEYNRRASGRALPKSQWFNVFTPAWMAGMTKEFIQAGFKMTGMVPLDRSKKYS